MENHLDPRLASGVRIGDLIIVSAIPHTKLPQTWAVTGRRDDVPQTWAVTGRRDDGTFSTWTVHLGALDEVPRVTMPVVLFHSTILALCSRS